MANYDSNYAIAQEISARIGTSPIPFDSVYSIALEIYNELGGEPTQFDSVYSILLGILPLVEGGIASKVIDDSVITTVKTWSSQKISDELATNKGYEFNGDTNGGFAEKYKQDAGDGGQIVNNTASGIASHAEGYNTTASGGYGAHAEGCETNASMDMAHAEGFRTTASGDYGAHAEGSCTSAIGNSAHAEGYGTPNYPIQALGRGSHAEGVGRIAQNEAEHAEGMFGVSHKNSDNFGDAGNTIHSIGNSYSRNNFHNAVEVMQNGDVYITGVGGYQGTDTKVQDATIKTLQEVVNSKASVEYVDEQIEAVAGTANSDIEGKSTEDFHFVTVLPQEAEEDEQVVIKGDNVDTLYKYVSGAWAEQTPDANILYFDTENEALYSYVTLEHQFAPVSMVNTIVVGSNLNSNAALKAIKTPGVYSVVQRLTNKTKGDYIKNWTLTVEGLDYDEYDKSDSIYQRIQSNYTIQKRTWSATRTTNDGWSNFSTYYAGEIKDSTTSKYYTWSSNKLSGELATKQNTLTAGQNVEITNNKIAAKGYFYDDEKKEELKLIDDILHASGMPAEMSLGLKISGAAGATTYTYTDAIGGGFAQLIQMGMLPGVGGTYKTANGKSGVIAAVDATTITFEETLDADNVLTNEPVDYVVYATQLFSFAEGINKYTEADISIYNFTISGAAGATTYTYTDSTSGMIMSACKSGSILKLQNGRSAKCISVEKIDSSTGNITFEVTFDEENAISNELVVSISNKNIASGKYSHVEGGFSQSVMILTNIASGAGSHAEGGNTTASGMVSHAEGEGTMASGEASHAEGASTLASGNYSHAEGERTTASGEASHAEGNQSIASGVASHAEGKETTASGNYSHAEGVTTTAQNQGEHAEGNSNLSHKASDTYGNAGNTQHSVGIGEAATKKNAVEVMQNGDVYITGIGGYQGTNTKVQDNTIKTLQEYIANLEARIAALENPNA